MKKNDPLEDELDDALSKLYARECDSDEYAENWRQLAIDLERDPDFHALPASKEFQRQVKRNIKRYKRKQFKKTMRRHRALTTVMVLALLAVPVTALAVNKETVFNFVISVCDEYATIRNQGEQKLYETDYLPSGYEFSDRSENGSIHITSYINAEGDKLTFWQHDSSASIQLDTEDAELVEQIKLSNMDAVLVEKDGLCKLIWGSNPQFMLSGSLDREEIIKIAEKIKIQGEISYEK